MANRTDSITFSDVELDWLKGRSLSDSAVAAYRGEVSRLSRFCAERGLVDLKRMQPAHWVQYIRSLSKARPQKARPHKPPLKASSVLQAIRITRAFLAHAAKRGWIAWQPRDVDLPRPSSPEAGAAPSVLPPGVRQVLGGEAQSSTETEARRHFALALCFWGALLPRDLCALKVKDLRMLRDGRGAALSCPQREQFVSLPSSVPALWDQYLAFRSERGAVRRSSPLISRLRTDSSLTPWALWSMVRADVESELSTTPRGLRAAYVTIAASDAEGDANLIRRQAGMRVRGNAVPDGAQGARIALLNDRTFMHLETWPTVLGGRGSDVARPRVRRRSPGSS